MLVLSRKLGESIEIGGGITVKVVAVRGGRVRLGIEAPDDVTIQRSEIADQCVSSLACPSTPMLGSEETTALVG